MATRILEVTDDDFAEEVLEDPLPVLVDFYTDDCVSCDLVAPEFKRAARVFEGQVKFVKAHSDACEATNQEYGHDAFPVLKLFIDGEEMGEVPWEGDDGYPTHDVIRDFLHEQLGTSPGDDDEILDDEDESDEDDEEEEEL